MPSLVRNFVGVTTFTSLVRKGKFSEFRSFGGVATCVSLDRNGKARVEFRRVPVGSGKSEILVVCFSVCIRNLITKKYVKGDGYWK